jgi:hypothetical protein
MSVNEYVLAMRTGMNRQAGKGDERKVFLRPLVMGAAVLDETGQALTTSSESEIIRAREDDARSVCASYASYSWNGSAIDTIAIDSASTAVLQLLSGIYAFVATLDGGNGAGGKFVRAEDSVLISGVELRRPVWQCLTTSVVPAPVVVLSVAVIVVAAVVAGLGTLGRTGLALVVAIEVAACGSVNFAQTPKDAKTRKRVEERSEFDL